MKLKIKQLRKEKKLTQEQLASKIGISVRMYSEYENETAEISVQKLKNIADSLQVSIYDLICIEDTINMVNEPGEKYEVGKPLNKDIKDQLIELLRDQNKELASDKHFLQKIIEKKFDLE